MCVCMCVFVYIYIYIYIISSIHLSIHLCNYICVCAYRHRNKSFMIIHYYLGCEAARLLQILMQAAFIEFLLCKRPWESHVEYAKMSNIWLMSLLEGWSCCCKHVVAPTRQCREKEVAEMGKSETIIDCSLFHGFWQEAWWMMYILFWSAHSLVLIVSIKRDISEVKQGKHGSLFLTYTDL